MAFRSTSRSAGEPFSKKTPDTGEHQTHEMMVTLPLETAGAYLIEASGADVTWRTMVLVSDVALVRKVAGDETILFAADARTGAPVEGAEVLVRQVHRARGIFGRYDKVTWSEGETGADGTWTRAHVIPERTRRINLEGFAAKNGHYALTRAFAAAPITVTQRVLSRSAPIPVMWSAWMWVSTALTSFRSSSSSRRR